MMTGPVVYVLTEATGDLRPKAAKPSKLHSSSPSTVSSMIRRDPENR